MTFKDLKITEPILKAIEEKGYTVPTTIQEKAIPAALAKRDILGCAQTGTGHELVSQPHLGLEMKMKSLSQMQLNVCSERPLSLDPTTRMRLSITVWSAGDSTVIELYEL